MVLFYFLPSVCLLHGSVVGDVKKLLHCKKNKLIFVLLQGNNQEHSRPPMVRVDPERRCSVMLIYGTHLVVLPFRQEGILDDHDVAYTGR